MPVRKRGDAWQITVCWKGRVYRKSSRHWDREKAGQVERKMLDDLHAIDVGRQPQRSFYEAVEKWKAEELPRHKDEARELAHMSALAPFLEGKNLEQATDIAEAAKKAWTDLQPATVNRRLALLRVLVNLAWRKWGWLEQPIGQKVTLLPVRNQRHVYLDRKQVERIAGKMPRSGGYALLAAYTGIRRGQLLRLTRANLVRIPKIGPCLNLGVDGKTGAPQLVPVHNRVRAIAAKLPLCTSQVLRDEWEAARKAVGLKDVKFHDLRHTHASWLLHAGADLMIVRDSLGHSSVAVTERYAHLKVQHLKTAMQRI